MNITETMPNEAIARKAKVNGRELSSRQRVLKAVNREEPDRVPLFITITPQIAQQLSRYLQIPEYTEADSPLSQNRISFHELMVELGNDVVGIGACSPDAFPARDIGSGVLTNEWGVKYKTAGYYSEMLEHPLSKAEEISDVANYHFPEPNASGRFRLGGGFQRGRSVT